MQRYCNNKMNCRVLNCNLPAKTYGLCSKHYTRWNRYKDVSLVKSVPFGKNHHWWKNGVAEYPKHTIMKRNRKLKILQVNGLCEKCGQKGFHIHHKDGSKDNHNLDNLMFLCIKCHYALHSGRKNKTSKFIRLYGYCLADLSKRLNIPFSKVWLLHKENLLANRLNKI